ncbi:MAG: hypothetical protein E7077_01435 [Bacteroidales bacterium]|nr:hypothetical protein [Bacteroidales bacterium]
MRYFSNILLLLISLFAQMPVSAASVNPNDFIIKHGKGSAYQTVMSGDSIEPFYYEYEEGVVIDHVQVPDAIFTVYHDFENRRIYLSGIAGGPTKSYEIRIWGLVTNDSLTKERISRPGKLTVLRPYLETEKKNFETDTETILDPIRIDYTKFTYSVWTSELPAGMKLVKGDDHCEIVSTETLPSGTYSFKVYGADSLYYSKDSIIVCDEPVKSIDTMKFHPKTYCDSIEFKINVYEGGLKKIGTGGTKQVVELGDSIEKFGFEWLAPGKLTNEPITPGLEMVIDSSKHDIWIQGAPTELGVHDFDIAYETQFSFVVYNIEVAVLREIRPIIEALDETTLSQVVSVGDMINGIELSYYNSDSVWVEGLPKGVSSMIDEEEEQISIYGTLEESGTYEVKVHARNERHETELKISLSTSDKTGGLSGIDDVLSENEGGRVVVYDIYGRRVSPENMGTNTVYIIKKKIVIRK